MIEPDALLADLQRLLERLVRDLRERAAEVSDLDAKLRAEHAAARDARRTAETFEEWREEALTQAGVHWILGCVFVRFLEDNHFVDRPYLSGPAERLTLARDRHTRFFQAHPTETDREYLLDVFREVAALPGAAGLYDERHNPIGWIDLSGDGARELLEFWQRVDPDTGALAHDFTDPDAGTRFLGDLYQDLSAFARKRYALLQTPEFVEEFILDRTLTPAIETFGYREVRLIDPTCGSGHFLLGAFRRLFDLHVRHEPATNPRELAQRALDQVAGVDVNPFATAIARFRLWIAALRACGVTRLADAPAFKLHLATGDSLLHGRRFPRLRGRTLDERPTVQLSLDDDSIRHVYLVEDRADLDRILGRPYHTVVGNPPYITVKDKALNQAYRDRYESCHRQYSLAVPFLERFFDLAIGGTESAPAGFVGTITANSFMKREFGKKLIEEFIPSWDVSHVIDSQFAHVPGHDTPTVILFGRNQSPLADTVRAVLGIRGENGIPDVPSSGLVWQAIVTQLDLPGSESEFLSVANIPRHTFHQHPWSLGGGGAVDLRDSLETAAKNSLRDEVELPIGRAVRIADEDVFVFAPDRVKRSRCHRDEFRLLLRGEEVRDWLGQPTEYAWYPYVPEAHLSPMLRLLWPWRAALSQRSTFQGTMAEAGMRWYEYMQHTASAYLTPLSISFAEVATHNHFVLDRGGKVFKQTAPVIKLRPNATEDGHLALLAILNASIACFWLRQVCHCKGLRGQAGGVTAEAWEQFFQFNATKLEQFPIAAIADDTRSGLVERARHIECHVANDRPLAISGQEDLDWLCYRVYGLTDEDLTLPPDRLPPIQLGERAFEIVLARKLAAGEVQTAWFERHGSTPTTEIPAHWPAEYRDLVAKRIHLIETDRNIALIEQPEYKRRWNAEAPEEVARRRLRGELLDRLEDPRYWSSETLTSCARLAEQVRHDAEFMKVAEVFRGTPDFDVTALVTELVSDEGVPFLPVLRYKEGGLRKRAQWERTWALQRQEDAIDARGLSAEVAKAAKRAEVSDIPVPPRYTSADFTKGSYWRLRGKLDVPKERFILYPHAERAGDDSPVLAWAGWDHLQQAKALATRYEEMSKREDWSVDRGTSLLAGLMELEPWLLQWHNALDPDYGISMGDYYRDFIDTELRTLGLTRDQAKAWTPTAKQRRPGRTKRD